MDDHKIKIGRTAVLTILVCVLALALISQPVYAQNQTQTDQTQNQENVYTTGDGWEITDLSVGSSSISATVVNDRDGDLRVVTSSIESGEEGTAQTLDQRVINVDSGESQRVVISATQTLNGQLGFVAISHNGLDDPRFVVLQGSPSNQIQFREISPGESLILGITVMGIFIVIKTWIDKRTNFVRPTSGRMSFRGLFGSDDLLESNQIKTGDRIDRFAIAVKSVPWISISIPILFVFFAGSYIGLIDIGGGIWTDVAIAVIPSIGLGYIVQVKIADYLISPPQADEILVVDAISRTFTRWFVPATWDIIDDSDSNKNEFARSTDGAIVAREIDIRGEEEEIAVTRQVWKDDLNDIQAEEFVAHIEHTRSDLRKKANYAREVLLSVPEFVEKLTNAAVKSVAKNDLESLKNATDEVEQELSDMQEKMGFTFDKDDKEIREMIEKEVEGTQTVDIDEIREEVDEYLNRDDVDGDNDE